MRTKGAASAAPFSFHPNDGIARCRVLSEFEFRLWWGIPSLAGACANDEDAPIAAISPREIRNPRTGPNAAFPRSTGENEWPEIVAAGGLISYSTNRREIG